MHVAKPLAHRPEAGWCLPGVKGAGHCHLGLQARLGLLWHRRGLGRHVLILRSSLKSLLRLLVPGFRLHLHDVVLR